MTVDVGDIRVRARRAGSGPPVVLIHGLAEDHTIWREVQEGIDDHETIAYDLRGHGATTLGAADGTLAQLAGDLAGLLTGVNGPAVCVGFSLGGTVVLRAAIDHPRLVTGAVVLGTSSVVGRAARAYFEERIGMAMAGDRELLAEAVRADTAGGLERAAVDVDDITARRLAAIGDGRGYANAARAMVGLNEHPLTPELRRIRCAVRVIGAEKDAFCPRQAADIMLAELPRADYAEVPAAGHLMHIDDPTTTTRLIRNFLAGEAA